MDELAMKHDKNMEEIQQNFKTQTAFICSICLTDMGCKEKIEALPCLHEYHSNCINEWLKNHDECPACRRPCGLQEFSITGQTKCFKQTAKH